MYIYKIIRKYMVFKYLYLFLFMSFSIGSSAYSDLCDPAWLGSVGRNEVRVFLEDKNESDVQQVCGKYGNTPLHIALMIQARFAVIRALIEKGANLFAENAVRQIPFTVIEERYRFDFAAKNEAQGQHKSKIIDIRELSRIRRQYEETAIIYRYLKGLMDETQKPY